MLAIGCKLRHQRVYPPTLNDHSKEAREGYIMVRKTPLFAPFI
jgi:hypothetical protein